MKTTINWSEALQKEKELKKQQQKEKSEFQQRLSEAKDDVEDRIYNNDQPFNYSDIEEIMDSHGLEMDYVEDFLI